MKKFSNILSIMLALCLVFALLPTFALAEGDGSYQIRDSAGKTVLSSYDTLTDAQTAFSSAPGGATLWSVWDGTAPDSAPSSFVKTNSGGLETIVINDAASFAYFAKYVNSTQRSFNHTIAGTTHYKQYATVSLEINIDLNNHPWTPIGNASSANFNSASNNFYFDGIFEGNGYTIQNLCINSSASGDNTSYAGLFAYAWDSVSERISFKNLTIDTAQISAPSCVGVGALVGGTREATFTNVTVKNTTVTAKKWVGGMVGYSYGTFNDCHVSESAIIGGYKAAGLCGFNAPAVIAFSNCTATDISVTTSERVGDANVQPFFTWNMADYSSTLTITQDNCTMSGVTLNGTAATAANLQAGHLAMLASGSKITYYPSLSAAITAAQNGDTVTLLKDVTVNSPVLINKNLVLDGNGHTLTTTGTVANAGCIALTANNMILTIKNLTCVSGWERGIKVNGYVTGFELNIENCTISAIKYALNSAIFTEGTININNSTLDSWAALNLWCRNSSVNAKNSTLKGTNIYSGDINSYGTVVLEGDPADDDDSNSTTVTLENCLVIAIATTEQPQHAFLFNPKSDQNSIVLKGNNTQVICASDLFSNDGFNNSLVISGGYYTADPTAYLAAGKQAVAGSYPVGGKTYSYMVTDQSEVDVNADVAIVAGETVPKLDDSLNNLDPDVKTALENTAKSAVAQGLTDAAAAIASNPEIITNSLVEQATELLSDFDPSTDNLTIVVEPYLEISVLAFDSDNKTLTLDVEAWCKLVATTGDPTDPDDMDDDDLTHDIPGSAAKLTNLGAPVTITIKLPSGFVSDEGTMYVKHIKNSTTTYVYEATVVKTGNDYFATFTNPNGFSNFILGVVPTASVTVNGSTTYFASLQDAVNTVNNGETIKLLVGNQSATVSRSVSFTVDPNPNNTYELTAGPSYVMQQDGDSYTFTYAGGGATNDDVFPFTDVAATDWFYGDVKYVFENDLMKGTDTTLFSPYGSTTRGMIATIVWRLAGEPKAVNANPFTDVAAGSYYETAIAWAAENMIVEGYGNAAFGPDDSITREQFAAILFRYATFKGLDVSAQADLSAFTDSGSISDYAQAAVKWAVAKTLLTGNGDGTLNPAGNAKRCESAALIHRFCETFK